MIIGDPLWLLGGASKDFAFSLVISGTTYNFDKNSTSSSVSNRYTFTKSGDDWSLIVYATATITFTKAPLLDYCLVGGGAGGGGARVFGSGYYQCSGYNGGSGGGGYYTANKGASFSANETYTLTIGAGGNGGGGGSGSGTSGTGTRGGTTSIAAGGATVASAVGGYGGTGATSGGSSGRSAGTAGAGGTAQNCFGDTSMPSVSGNNRASYPGGGGAGGGWKRADNPVAYSGGKGAAGLIVIRNARS